MFSFAATLKNEVDAQLVRIEQQEDQDMIQKSSQAIKVLEAAYDDLKSYVVNKHEFLTPQEEIHFFKHTKPKLNSRLIFYRKVYNIEMNRPEGGVEIVTQYLNTEVRVINNWIKKRLDFIRYYRSDSSHQDCSYFLRGAKSFEQYHETFQHERDKRYSTIWDFKVARLLANEQLMTYLQIELEKLDTRANYPCNPSFPLRKMQWRGTKTQLYLLIIGSKQMGCFGNDIPMTQIENYIGNVFDIDVDRNLSRVASDLSSRINPLQFFRDMEESVAEYLKITPKRESNDATRILVLIISMFTK